MTGPEVGATGAAPGAPAAPSTPRPLATSGTQRTAREVARRVVWLRTLRRWLGLGDTAWLLLLAATFGLAAAGMALVFQEAIVLVQRAAWGSGDRAGPLAAALAAPGWRVVLVPTVGGLLAGLLVWRARRPVAGLSLVMRAIREGDGRIDLLVGPLTLVTCAITLGCGLSLGREAPAVGIGAATAAALAQLAGVTPRQRRILVAGGAAAGLASVFNAPLGGAVFALEVLMGTLALEAAGPVLVAAMAGAALGRGLLGNAPAVQTPPYHLGHPVELLAYAALGVACGVLAAAFGRGLVRFVRAADRLPLPTWATPALGGLAVGLLSLLVTPRLLGNGYETVDALVHGRPVQTALLLLVGVKLLATWASLGSGAPGGLFGPSLFLGAATGALVGGVAGGLVEASPTGAYAVVGMAAVVAGTTHAPLAMVLMLFEMTSDYAVVLPLLLATTLASVVSRRLNPTSLDHAVDVARGRRACEATGALTLEVEEAMRPCGPEATVQPGAPLDGILERFLRARSDLLPVVDAQGRYQGAILLEDVQAVLREIGAAGRAVVADDLRRDDLPVLGPDDSLAEAVDALHVSPCGTLPVVEPATGQPVGLLEGKQVLSVWRSEQLQAEVQALIREPAQAAPLDLGPGSDVVRIDAPAWLVGKSLAEADLRRRTGLSVLAVRVGGVMRLPDARTPLEAGAVLLVAGPDEALRALGAGELPAELNPR